jgi:hypothetical protein
MKIRDHRDDYRYGLHIFLLNAVGIHPSTVPVKKERKKEYLFLLRHEFTAQ